jgi:chemotaxis protein histidine kinase CheA
MDDTELLREFAVESQEHLADIENQLLTLESQGDAMDVGLVNTVFRAIHSIKGAAGFMGLETLGGLAHRAEEVLGRLRSHELRPTSLVVNTLLRATDRLKELIDQVESSNGQDVSRHITDLERILAGEIDDVEGAEDHSSSVDQRPSNAFGQKNDPNGSEEESSAAEILQLCFDFLEQIVQDLLVLDRAPGERASLENAIGKFREIRAIAEDLEYAKVAGIVVSSLKLLDGVQAGDFPMDPQISETLGGAIKVLKKSIASILDDGTEGKEDHQFTVDFLEAVLSVKVPTKKIGPSSAPAATATPPTKPKEPKNEPQSQPAIVEKTA